MPSSRIKVRYTKVPTERPEMLHAERWLDMATGVLYIHKIGWDTALEGMRRSFDSSHWNHSSHEWEVRTVESLEAAQCPGMPKTEDAKADTGKPRFDLLDTGCADAVLDVVRVLTWAVEVKGYTPHSWKTVPDARRRYEAALSRHRNALARGETHDAESGFPHQAHIATNALFLAQLEYNN